MATEELPEHYNKGGGQWAAGDLIRLLGLGFDEGSAIKYLIRHKEKGGAEDIRKTIEYCKHILCVDYGVEE